MGFNPAYVGIWWPHNYCGRGPGWSQGSSDATGRRPIVGGDGQKTAGALSVNYQHLRDFM